MLVVMQGDATPVQITAVCDAIKAMGFKPVPMPGAQRTAIGLVGNDGLSARPAREATTKIGTDELPNDRTLAQSRRDLVAMAAEVERQRKGAAHVVQTVDQPLGDLALQEIMTLPVAGRALAALTQDGAVKHQQGVGTRHSGYVGKKGGGR